MQVALSPNEACQVTLQAQQWQSVIAVLHDAPYRVAKPLIDAIIGQCQEQAGLAGQGPRAVG